MDILETTIEDLDASQQVATAGGSYPQAQLGIAGGVAVGAAVLVSGGLLGAAFAFGGAFLMYEAL
jgi:hypothetical protein